MEKPGTGIADAVEEANKPDIGIGRADIEANKPGIGIVTENRGTNIGKADIEEVDELDSGIDRVNIEKVDKPGTSTVDAAEEGYKSLAQAQA